MKNINQTSLLTSAVLSIIMFAWANMLFLFMKDQPDIVAQNGFCFWLLQAVLIIKYATGSLVAIPGKVSLRYLMLGFIAADTLIGLVTVYVKDMIAFPVTIVIAQALLLVFHLVTEQQQPFAIRREISFGELDHQLITGGI